MADDMLGGQRSLLAVDDLLTHFWISSEETARWQLKTKQAEIETAQLSRFIPNCFPNNGSIAVTSAALGLFFATPNDVFVAIQKVNPTQRGKKIPIEAGEILLSHLESFEGCL